MPQKSRGGRYFGHQCPILSTFDMLLLLISRSRTALEERVEGPKQCRTVAGMVEVERRATCELESAIPPPDWRNGHLAVVRTSCCTRYIRSQSAIFGNAEAIRSPFPSDQPVEYEIAAACRRCLSHCGVASVLETENPAVVD